jgi:hypothetical protein
MKGERDGVYRHLPSPSRPRPRPSFSAVEVATVCRDGKKLMEKAIGERFACTSNQETAENDDNDEDEKKGIQR